MQVVSTYEARLFNRHPEEVKDCPHNHKNICCLNESGNKQFCWLDGHGDRVHCPLKKGGRRGRFNLGGRFNFSFFYFFFSFF